MVWLYHDEVSGPYHHPRCSCSACTGDPAVCVVCNSPVALDRGVWVDETGGDVCATDVLRYGENHPHMLAKISR